MFRSFIVTLSLMLSTLSFANEIEFNVLDLNPGQIKDVGNLEIHARYSISYKLDNGIVGELGNYEVATYDIEKFSGAQSVPSQIQTIKLKDIEAHIKRNKLSKNNYFVVVTIQEFQDLGVMSGFRRIAVKEISLNELMKNGSVMLNLKGAFSSEFRVLVNLK